jgi:hypothetical protein
VFEPAQEALRQDGSVLPALQAVVHGGMSAEAQQFAERALMALSGKELQTVTEGQKHVMLSYSWNYQSIMIRLNEVLIARGYLTVRLGRMTVSLSISFLSHIR